MNKPSLSEYCLILEGTYYTEEEAEKALREPFIEEWIEETGNFRIHNFDEIEVCGGIALGWLIIEMVDDDLFEITCRRADKILTQDKAKIIAGIITRHGMFDDVHVEPKQS